MKIAIIGTGISGLTVAHRLYGHHELKIFESNHYIGVHTNTIDVDFDGEKHAIDTGFIVFNERNYPHFVELLLELNISTQSTSMSFGFRCDETGLEYNGTNLNGLFAQRRNLLNWRFFRLIKDFQRFNREMVRFPLNESVTVEQFFTDNPYSREFRDQYFLPMGSAIWSCPRRRLLQFPMRLIIDFYRNHGLLSLYGQPEWKVICGGSRTYVEAITKRFAHNITINRPVVGVIRKSDKVSLSFNDGISEDFEHVIFACHSDQALALLGGQATKLEKDLLSAVPYQKNTAILHTDHSILPRSRRAWASWNYLRPVLEEDQVLVTYNMNILQNLNSKHVYCVTLNGESRIDPSAIIRRIDYHHPVFTSDRRNVAKDQQALLGRNHSSFCGAYWGYGFHEDGVKSALTVSDALMN